MRLLSAAILYLLSSIFGPCPRAENLGQYVLVVANKNAPDSLPIARYYASKRDVPERQILALDCPATEQISRADYVRTIESPIRGFLEKHGLLLREPVVSAGDATAARTGLVTVKNKIRYIVLCYGVPLKVAADPKLIEPNTEKWQSQFRRNEAAVDSELALLPIEFPKTGVIPNPLYGFPNSTFTEPMNNRLMLVTRLDGPTAEDAKALVDRALEGERFGLLGRGYFDARGLKSGGYLMGDEWIRKSYELARRAGFECVLDEHGEIFDAGYPMTDCVLYAGWYTGSIAGALSRKDFRFRPGAVAYHLHSDSAGTLRSETTCWVGPLVARGAACTMGCVYEPYLPGSPDIAIWFDHLLQGFNFAESAYASQQWLSWQTTFVGDPLYRPFALSLDEQIAALEKAKRADVVFAYLRKINLMLNEGKKDPALAYARELNERFHSPVLTEKLGDMILDRGDTVAAIEEYRAADHATRDDWQAIRLQYKMADAYQKLGKEELALQSLESILKRRPDYEGRIALYLRMIPLAHKIGPATKVNEWKAEVQKLSPSLTNHPALK